MATESPLNGGVRSERFGATERSRFWFSIWRAKLRWQREIARPMLA